MTQPPMHFSGLAWLTAHCAATAALLMMTLAGKAETAKGDAVLGEYLSNECVSCHQLSGRFDGIPPIVGWPESTFVKIMGQYRQKTRSNPVMQTIAARLTDEELSALAAYFGGLTPKP